MSNTTHRADEVDDSRGEGDDAAVDAHLADVPAGAGCTEIWETLSERRDADAERSDSADADEPDDE